ncbi:MAG: AraC family transcriptional regulator [Ginsengibacter sp.]
MRCKTVVMEELKKLGLRYVTLDLGVVILREDINSYQLDQLKRNLLNSGLEVLDDNNSILIEKIKNVIIDMVHYSNELPIAKYSDYISEKLNLDYTYLSNLFSAIKGTTIQQFIIDNKIEKAKELLLYNELNITVIAEQLHYSSISHFSHQFKKITGLSPTFYKMLKKNRNKNLEDL